MQVDAVSFLASVNRVPDTILKKINLFQIRSIIAMSRQGPPERTVEAKVKLSLSQLHREVRLCVLLLMYRDSWCARGPPQRFPSHIK
jgi:hypothetical protein